MSAQIICITPQPSPLLAGRCNSHDQQYLHVMRRKGDKSCTVKSFPCQEGRVLAKAFKQLLNIWAAEEQSVLEKCGGRAHIQE